jgi:putative phage-type endonuclease
MSLTPQQLEQRLDYITGSDAAIICGISPWGNIIELWQQKLRLAEQKDIGHLPAVKAGIYLEPVVEQWFCDETGKLTEVDTQFHIHKTIPFMAGNIDRRITDENAILECKTTSRNDNWGVIGDNTIPDYYLCQVAHYAAVCDVEVVYVAVLIRGSDFRWYTYERNSKLEDTIIRKETEFWECVKNETPPEPRSLHEIASLYSIATNEEPLIANQGIEAAINSYQANGKKIKELEEEQDRLQAFIKSYMKERDTLHGLNGNIIATWKNAKGAIRFDGKRFAKENPKLYEQYLKQSDLYRRFLIK